MVLMEQEKKIVLQLTFNPGLTLTGFRTTQPRKLYRRGWGEENTRGRFYSR